MAQPDPRLANPVLLALAGRRAAARKAPLPALSPDFPAGWWEEFVHVCCRELPAFGMDILVGLGVPAAEVQSLSTLPEEAWYQATARFRDPPRPVPGAGDADG